MTELRLERPDKATILYSLSSSTTMRHNRVQFPADSSPSAPGGPTAPRNSRGLRESTRCLRHAVRRSDLLDVGPPAPRGWRSSCLSLVFRILSARPDNSRRHVFRARKSRSLANALPTPRSSIVMSCCPGRSLAWSSPLRAAFSWLHLGIDVPADPINHHAGNDLVVVVLHHQMRVA